MARFPKAEFRGPVPNRTPNAMIHPAHGVVEHVEQGSESGTDSWFHNPAAKASADFGIAKNGHIHQWVDTNDKAWAEAFYNPHWYSIETEGFANEPLTAAQIESFAEVTAWLSRLDKFPLQVTDNPNGYGLITHGDLGGAGGGHLNCPGNLRKAQRQQIINRAKQLNKIVSPSPIKKAVHKIAHPFPGVVFHQGSEGYYVKQIQKALGFSSQQADGIFGKFTDARVRSFQRLHGLKEDGIVGKDTWRALFH